jgi:hypothetical protein
MKFNEKQIDDIARLLGTLAASSIIGLTIGAARPQSVTNLEELGLVSSAVLAFAVMLLIRRNP